MTAVGIAHVPGSIDQADTVQMPALPCLDAASATLPLRALDAEAAESVQSWADELHPWWCSERYATGCGTHMSSLDGVIATADRGDISPDGWAPLVSVAAFMGEDGSQGVQVHMMRRGGEAWATFTADEWRQIVAQGEKALGLIGSDPKMAPLPTRPCDEPAERVEPLEGEALTEHLQKIRDEFDAEDAGAGDVA